MLYVKPSVTNCVPMPTCHVLLNDDAGSGLSITPLAVHIRQRVAFAATSALAVACAADLHITQALLSAAQVPVHSTATGQLALLVCCCCAHMLLAGKVTAAQRAISLQCCCTDAHPQLKQAHLQVALLLCCLVHWPLCRRISSSSSGSSGSFATSSAQHLLLRV
jgi:hypothetical protein